MMGKQQMPMPFKGGVEQRPFIPQPLNLKKPFRQFSVEETYPGMQQKMQSSPYMFECSSPVTRSTEVSSSDDEKYTNNSEFDVFSRGSSRQMSQKVETNNWKRKVKTELCKFWLNGQPCENSQKEQGCGFAHGQDELQKKKGLSKQYMTSVCKNFLDHPSKCTYGQRCIFQHPTYDVKQRQPYTNMVEDNAKYTAMRLFQEIEGADVIYINTYAATAPRLPVFRSICSNAKDNGEDHIDDDEQYDGGIESGNCSENSECDEAQEDFLCDLIVVEQALKAGKGKQ